MKYLLLCVLLLAGCSTTVPVAMKFPSVPAELNIPCPELEQTPAETKQLSRTLEIVVRNYGKYHECKTKTDAWQEWYRDQKKIFESVK
jgi:hypothetical protein